MIVADSSVWIAFLRGIRTAEVEKFENAVSEGGVLLLDLVLCEVLQGAPSDREARRFKSLLFEFDIGLTLNSTIAVRGAENYRKLRTRGVTLSQTTDLLIGTFCVENGHTLLTADPDFDAMRDHLGLKTL